MNISIRSLLPFMALCLGLSGTAGDLPLPDVPATLREPAARADYVAMHFWDAADWVDSMSTAPASVAQNVANFLSVFPIMSSDSARTAAADIFVTRALKAGEAQALAASHALEDCLFGDQSQQRDESLYAIFLERMIAAGYPDSVRSQYMLEVTRKNSPGTKAADFAFTTRDGRQMSLSQFVDRPTVILFYDPDCHNCHQLAASMADDPVLNAMLADGLIKVLAVSPGDAELWQEHGAWLPHSWTDATDNGVIDEDELYYFNSFPSLYLLDGNAKVVLKDCSPEQLIEYTTNL